PATVQYAVTGGTAQNNLDYKLPAGTVTFAAGQTLKTIQITIVNDLLSGPPETVVVTLSSPSANVDLGPTTVHTFSILNTVAVPKVAFTAAAVSGQEGATPGLLRVTLSAKSEFTVSVNYSVTGGAATGGTDFNLAAGTLTFTPGQTVQVIPIDIVDDVLA